MVPSTPSGISPICASVSVILPSVSAFGGCGGLAMGMSARSTTWPSGGKWAAIAQALSDLGGKLEAIYFTLGDRDVLILCDCPDNASAASLGMAASASGMVRTKITALLTVEELDQTLSKGISYKAPGT